MKKVVTFGEIMLRLASKDYLRFVQSEEFEATYGGAEANVAISLANYGIDSLYVSKLPNHEIGQAALNSLRKYGVDTSYVLRGGDRLGIYYLEKGASQRPSKVIYDRKDSSFALSKEEDFNFDKIFKDCSWFHITGITPALSDEVAKITLNAVKKAKKLGLTVSLDLNYRQKLWSKEKANSVLTEICKYVDICIANEEDALDVFNIKAEKSDINSGSLSSEGYKEVCKKLKEKFNFKSVCITLRESISANDNNWSAILLSGDEFYFSDRYSLRIVDRVGGGDSFTAGFIAATLKGYQNQDIINLAVAASALKHSILGDFNLVSWEEVEKLANGNKSGRIQR